MNHLRADFEEFDRANPRVYELFCQFCQRLINAGRTHYSPDAVMHVIRFHFDVETVGAGVADGQVLKLNNNHVRFYADKWAAAHPEHPKFFSKRKRTEEQMDIKLSA